MSKGEMQNQPPMYASAVPAYQVNMEPQYPAPGWNGGVYPPPPEYAVTANPLQQGNVTAVIVNTTPMKNAPTSAVCPSCHLPCTTRIEYNSGCLVTLLCCLMFFFGCVLGCCLIPLCIDSFKDVDHFCPHCNHHICKYKRL